VEGRKGMAWKIWQTRGREKLYLLDNDSICDGDGAAFTGDGCDLVLSSLEELFNDVLSDVARGLGGRLLVSVNDNETEIVYQVGGEVSLTPTTATFSI